VTTITPGTYKLKVDIVNPRPDGRVRHDWRKEKVWKAGRTFYISECGLGFTGDRTVLQIHSGRYNHQRFYFKEEEFELIIPQLERAGDEDHKLTEHELVRNLSTALKELLENGGQAARDAGWKALQQAESRL
jgi:hypothetical protein